MNWKQTEILPKIQSYHVIVEWLSCLVMIE